VASRAQVIHEFDPHFNYRTTRVLVNEGFYNFLNWFDDRVWYPLGRVVGGTIYPGLMATAALLQNLLNYFHLTINTRNMCVFLAPIFAAFTAIATYLMTTEVSGRKSAGLVAAALIAIVPSYISRSVGGSYDNEGVAIFALVFTFYTWVKAAKTGSLMWAAFSALAYFYMVASWGGYVFIINIIPIYMVIMVVAGRYSSRLYVAYSTFYVLGSLLAMQVPFVGFNVIQQAECAASHGVFVLVQVYELAVYLRGKVGEARFRTLVFGLAAVVVLGAAAMLVGFQLTGKLGWTGRSLSLLDPTYAKKYIPIIASVSEHQPTAWTSFFFDLHICVALSPVGLYLLFQHIDDGKIFLILYGTISWYFAGVMVRLMLTLAPAACMLAGIGASGLLSTFSAHAKLALQEALSSEDADDSKSSRSSKRSAKTPSESSAGLVSVLMGGGSPSTFPLTLSLSMIFGVFVMLVMYALHASYVASEAYSSPSIVLASRRADGSKLIFDDFREAYYWLRMNTAEDARVMSWWDYGYQTSSMGNRTVIVDNNTWNNTHIATVGRAMSTPEDEAYPIMRSLDVDYVLVIFGGTSGYQSDDINKFLWMVRIGGGVFPHIKEPDYFAQGQYRMDAGGSPTMLNTMMYKMSYYRFDELRTDMSRPGGYDRARGVEIGNKGFKLEHLDEVFTSEHWIVRIFKVKKPVNRHALPSAPSAVEIAKNRRWSPDSARQQQKGPATQFVGCFASEDAFGGRQYHGGSSGANFNLIRHKAVHNGQRFFAVARAGGDGHSFTFDRVQGKPIAPDQDCLRPCVDDGEQKCGCADGGCSGSPLPGQEHNRRWAVYKIVK
jgi:dolichyl-diphosphooligosaccharide---protein glycosyltransferase